jgi:hypothetical protein
VKYKASTKWLAQYHLEECRRSIPKELEALIRDKVSCVLGSLGVLTFEQMCTYEKLIMMGYLAANCTSDEEIALEMSLTPLGKALE